MDTKSCRKFYKNIKFDFQTNEKKISLISYTGMDVNSNAGKHPYKYRLLWKTWLIHIFWSLVFFKQISTFEELKEDVTLNRNFFIKVKVDIEKKTSK